MGPQGPLARIDAGAADARWYCYDGLGSVLAEVDVNGVAQGTRKYDVYGATRSYSGTPVGRQAFVGQLGHTTDDETGLTYMRARYYDNVTGRFISQDKKGAGGNWFAYCDNDPINYSDSDGQCKFAEWRGWFCIAGFVLAFVSLTMLLLNAIDPDPYCQIAALATAGLASLCFAVSVAGLTNTGASLLALSNEFVNLVSTTVAGFGALLKKSWGLPGVVLALGSLFVNMLIVIACLSAINIDESEGPCGKW